MRNYKCDPLMMGQRLKELRRNAKNSMSQLAFAEEIGTRGGPIVCVGKPRCREDKGKGCPCS